MMAAKLHNFDNEKALCGLICSGVAYPATNTYSMRLNWPHSPILMRAAARSSCKREDLQTAASVPQAVLKLSAPLCRPLPTDDQSVLRLALLALASRLKNLSHCS